jgi:hypothetical protein
LKNKLMFFGFEADDEKGQETPKSNAPATSWNIWDGLKEAGQLVAR